MSWLNLSNNLSNISGNFTSLTGQISNFTREVLTESTDETLDHDAELKLAHLKIKDLENALQKQKDEVERVSQLNEELRDRSISSELQIQALSDEYRGVIEEKEQKIQQLKSSQIDLKHGPYPPHKDESFTKEGMEFEDPEFFQMTVNKLKKELDEVQKQCQYWKDAAKDQNNQAELQQLKDHHQQEIASLQSTYSKRMSLMNKKHQGELEDLLLENDKLSNQLKEIETLPSNRQPTTTASNDGTVSKELEDKHKKLSIDFEIKKKQLESLQIQILEEKRLRKAEEEINASLLLEIKERNEKIIELEGEVESLLSNQGEKEKCVSFDTNEKEKLEELDQIWRSKFDRIFQDLNEARDENVAITLELSQLDEKFQQLKTENDDLLKNAADANAEIEKLNAEKRQLEENVKGLDKLKDDVSRLGNCTSDLLEELEFQKGLSEEQLLEIDSLRKICTIKGSPADEIKKLHKSLKELGRRYVELYQHYQKVSLELRKSNDRLRAERQLRHTSTSQLREEIFGVHQRLGKNVDSKLDTCKTDSEHIHNQLSELDQQLDRRERIVAELQLDNEYVADDVAKSVSELGHQSDRSSKGATQNETIESLIAEKSILERTIEGLERKVGSLEALVVGTNEDNSTVDGTASPPRTIDNSPRDSDADPSEPVGKWRRLDQETSSLTGSEKGIETATVTRKFSLNDGTADGYFFDDEQPSEGKAWLQKRPEVVSRDQMKVAELQEEVLALKKELNETNVIKSDLEFEKSTLEKVVLDLQKRVKLKIRASENSCSFVDVSHQESETDVSSLEWDNLTEATEERKILAEELDRTKKNLQQLEQTAEDIVTFLSGELKKTSAIAEEVEDPGEHVNAINRLEKFVRFFVSLSSEQMQGFRDDVRDREGALSKRDEDLEQLTAQVTALTNEVDSLNSTLKRVKDSAEGVTKRILEARGKKSESHEEDSIENESCEDAVRQVGSLIENVLSGLSSETDADKWRNKYDDVMSEKSLLARELDNVKGELQQWKGKHRDLVDENSSLLESIDMLRQDLELMSQGQSALSAEREQLQTELDKLQFQIDTNETDDSKEIGELKMQLDDLKLERERIMKMVNDRDDFIVEQQEKHDAIVYQLMEEKDRDLQEIQSQLEETMKLFKEKHDECARINAYNISLEEENKLSKDRLNDLDNELTLRTRKIEKLERELSDKMQKVMEKDVILKSLEEEDEELREKEMIEEDMLREQEILIQDLRSENEYLRDELNVKELLLKKNENSNDSKKSNREEELSKDVKLLKDELSQYYEMGEDIEKWKSKAGEFDNLLRKHEDLWRQATSYKNSIKALECKVADLEGYHKARQSPTIEEADSTNRQDSREQSGVVQEKPLNVGVEEEVKRCNVIEVGTARSIVESVSQHINAEEKRLVEDLVKAQERIRELELEVDTYKKIERIADEKEFEIEKMKSEVGRMMQVLRSKDELLLNLQMMEEEVNSDSPFSSRARVIQHIRDKDTEIDNIREKCGSLEELAKHHSSQLELLKVERQNLLIFLQQKDAEAIDLNEKLENIQARSIAKEHASAVLHAEHQKLTELNKSQGSEIARLRERIQYLQNLLQERQKHSVNEKMIAERNQGLEIQIAAFQQEQERLLTLMHEKDNYSAELKRELDRRDTANEISNHESVGHELQNRVVNSKIRNESLLTSQTENDVKISRDTLHKYELELSELKEKLRSLKESNSKLTNDNSELKQKLDLNENEKRKIRTLMENQDYDKSAKIKDLEINLTEMEKRILDMNRNFEMERSRILQNFESRTKLVTREWEENVRLKDQEVKSLLEQIDLLQSVKEQMEKSSVNSEKSDQLNVENKKLLSLYEEKKNEISILQNDIHKLKSISSAHEAALNKMQNDNKYLIEEGSKKDSIIDEINKKKVAAEQKVQELETEVHRLRVNCREIEAKATKDMERLRNHLIEIEEGYTNEAVAAQGRENDLEKKLREFQELYQTKNMEFKETSNQSNFQIHNLQQQLYAIATQRDDAVTKLAQTQERLKQTETALNNLQLVLERLQREKDSQYEMLEEESRKKLLRAAKEIEDLKKKEASFQARIQEANLAVQGVANLSKEVQSKDEIISTLKKEVNILQDDLNAKSEIVRKLKDSTEGKVEKPLMKNLLLGYFHTPENKRPEVVRVLGNLVGFSQDEIDQVGSGAPALQRTWVSSLNPFGSAPPKTAPRPLRSQHSSISDSLSKSFTEMFVSFLEEESTIGSKANRPTTNQLTSLLMDSPKPASSQVPSSGAMGAPSTEPTLHSTAISNPLLITPQDARAMHASTFKTNLPLLSTNGASVSTSLFPAPGQEIPRVHTSTATSALRTMLSK